jgi:hypothetical protein
MKRKIALILSLLLILLTACNTNNLLEYKKAAEKREQITKGQTSGAFTVITEINRDGLTAEEIKELNYIKDMQGSYSVVFDEDEEKIIIRNYMNLGGLGYDLEVYINGEEMSMKLPVVGKYLKIDKEIISVDEEAFEKENQVISEKTIKELTEKWLGLMNEEDVFRGKGIILTTPDGEVKTTEYTIKLNNEQIKSLLKDCAGILPEDENLKAFYEKNIRANAEFLQIKTFEEFINDIIKAAEEFYVEKFNYTAYVDIDGYIVNEIIEISIKAIDSEKEGVVGMDYNLDIKSWDINKEQKFDFPVLTDENTLKIEDLDVDMPNAFINN